MPRLSFSCASRSVGSHSGNAFDIELLSVILLLNGAVIGGATLIQGLRRIGDLAKINMFATALGVGLSIPIAYIWGLQGIPAYMVLMTAVGALTTWSYVRRIQIEAVKGSSSSSRN